MSKEEKSEKNNDKLALKISLVAVLTAIVVVFTLIVRIPTSRGYLNLCDVAIFFTAFTFGPGVAFIVAGLGTAIADIVSGYAQWAIVSFIVHGSEGLVVAIIVHKAKKPFRKILGAVIGVLIVAIGYYFGGAILVNFEVALIEVPMNLAQAGVGAVLGSLVAKAVRKAYPPIEELIN